MAKHKLEWSFTTVDNSKKALFVAKINAKINQVKNVRFLASNLFTSISTKEKFDIVVTNPPYVSFAEYQTLDKFVKKQPRTALVAKGKGYYFYHTIFRQVGFFLTKRFLLSYRHVSINSNWFFT